jgi:hypothetical protein
MTRDFNERDELTSDYGKWRREPWNFDFAGVDDGSQKADFAAAFRKGDEGFLSESSEGYF